MKKTFFLLLLAVLCCTACSRKKPGIDHGAVAAQAARRYYRQLLAGKYENFYKGLNMTDSVPESFHRQMLTNLEQYRQRQDTLHGGVKAVRIHGAQFSGKDSTASAYLVFSYGDGSEEQIVVPMVKRRHVWLMR